MWNKLKPTLVCLFIGLVFSGAALAEKQHKPVRPRVTTFASNFSAESFADFLSPGVSLGEDFSPLFQKKIIGTTWTISSALLILPKTDQGPGRVFSFGNDLASTAFDSNTFVTSTFINYGSFQPLVLLVFYQGQVAVVPEASAGVMMALGLPLLGWLAWRRQRLG